MSFMLNPFVLFPSASGPIFLDTFSGAEVAITAHTPDVDTVGGGWIAGYTATHWKKSPDYLANNSADVRNGPVADMGVYDCVITGTFVAASADASTKGITFRNSSTTTNPSNECYFNGSSLRLFENGVSRAALTGKTYDSAGARHDVVVTLNGASVSATMLGDTVSYGSYTYNATVTKHGPSVGTGFGASDSCFGFRVDPL